MVQSMTQHKQAVPRLKLISHLSQLKLKLVVQLYFLITCKSIRVQMNLPKSMALFQMCLDHNMMCCKQVLCFNPLKLSKEAHMRLDIG
jgi:hypothetical protein